MLNVPPEVVENLPLESAQIFPWNTGNSTVPYGAKETAYFPVLKFESSVQIINLPLIETWPQPQSRFGSMSLLSKTGNTLRP